MKLKVDVFPGDKKVKKAPSREFFRIQGGCDQSRGLQGSGNESQGEPEVTCGAVEGLEAGGSCGK